MVPIDISSINFGKLKQNHLSSESFMDEQSDIYLILLGLFVSLILVTMIMFYDGHFIVVYIYIITEFILLTKLLQIYLFNIYIYLCVYICIYKANM